MATEDFDFYGHIAGDERCPCCFGAPSECPEPDCPGLLHCEMIEAHYDGYAVAYCCDVCEYRDCD